MADISTMSKEDFDAIKNQGDKLLKNRVSTPEVKGSAEFDTGAKDKPHGVQEESSRETNKLSKTEEIEEGKKTAASKQVGELGQKPATDKKTAAEIEEELNKAALIEKSHIKTKEMVEGLEKTKEAREKQAQSPEEVSKKQQDMEKEVYRQTKEHEEKLAEKGSDKGHTAVLDGSATRNSMKAEEKLMDLKADPTPGMDKAGRGGPGLP